MEIERGKVKAVTEVLPKWIVYIALLSTWEPNSLALEFHASRKLRSALVEHAVRIGRSFFSIGRHVIKVGFLYLESWSASSSFSHSVINAASNFTTNFARVAL